MQYPIQFWHLGAIQTVSAAGAGRSVLNYVRQNCSRTGTKEGCAEGDCGACAVLVVSDSEQGLQFQSVNACILPVANLHGKLLLTVEDLKKQSSLHPVQQAMLDQHASQCGFCTPGFVVSLTACFEQKSCAKHTSDRQAVVESVSGNLCRCTGYRPIVNAGVAAMQSLEQGLDHAQLKQHIQALQNHIETQSHGKAAVHPPMVLEGATVLTPRSLQQLNQAISAHPKAVISAGMTDVGLWFNKQLRDIPVLISVTQIPELKGIHHTVQGLDVGAAVTLSELNAHLLLLYPELHEWAERFASLPIRNSATMGGNVMGGSPIGDSMPVLLALDAVLLLQHGDSQRHVALKDFYIAYQQKDLKEGEFLRRIIIPKRPNTLKLAVYKISKRFEDDISSVCAALAFEVEHGVIQHARLGFGGVAATPIRAYALEKAFENQPFEPSTFEAATRLAQEVFSPLSDHRASAAYRQKMCASVLRRASLEWFSDEKTRVFAGVQGGL